MFQTTTFKAREGGTFAKWSAAQSVNAIQGLKSVQEDVCTSTVIGISCAIRVFLFLIQLLGKLKLAPWIVLIVIIWLSFNSAFGSHNVVKFTTQS